MMGNEAQINSILDKILRVEVIEEAFSCVIVHNSSHEKAKIKTWQAELSAVITAFTSEQQDNVVKKFINVASDITNYKKMHLIISILENLVATNVLPARLVCENILCCEKLHYHNKEFWVESFMLIRRIIGGVDYKNVREIMKACKEKAHTLPLMIDVSVQSQMKVLENLMEYILDRNSCLLPSYLINYELQKHSESQNWPHWLAKLLSNFIDGFRNVVQMISIIGHSKMLPIVEHTGYSDDLVSQWLLNRDTLQFSLKGSLPYDPELLKPQTHLLRYVLEQPYSRDMICSMLRLQKQQNIRCIVLEEQLVDLMIRNMEKAENENTSEEGSDAVISSYWPWLHLSSQLIHYVLFQFVQFPSIVMSIHNRLLGREWKKSRNHLMWVILQFVSGTIQRNPLSCFLPIFKLYDLLYPEKDPLPIPDLTHFRCTHEMALICIWLHLIRKAQVEHSNCHRPIPHNLKLHYEFLQQTTVQTSLSVDSDYKIVLLCNAYSSVSNNEYFTRSMAALFESIQKQGTQQPQLQSLLSNNPVVNNPTVPLSMSILDSLTVHAKMVLIHHIAQHVLKSAQFKSNTSLSPALVETYSRLLVYTEIEILGITSFINQLLPNIFKAHAWGTLYTLLDMFSHRMHHIQPQYRVQILSNLHNLASVPQTNQTQLHLCVESTALRLITGLGSTEVQFHLSRFLSEPKAIVSADSEELNRVLVLTLARSMHITGTGSDTVSANWCKDLLKTIMQNTPHSWANHTLQSFPPVLHEFFQNSNVPKEDKQQIKKAVEEEYNIWASMNNENDIIAHFSVPGTPPLFLCLLWKIIHETDRIGPIAYKILERIGARGLSAHLRQFCDYIVFEVSSTTCDGSYVNKSVDAVNDMIWKYNIVTFDRLILCLALRALENNEAQVCSFIIQLLLLKASEFRDRVAEFVKENSPDYWKQSDWHEKHLAFHGKFPEKFAPEGIMEQSAGSLNQYQNFPAYFGNVCLRFIPVFDIVLHRYLEIPQVTQSLEVLLEHLGCLYRFHDRPIMYLYNTLHYYEQRLRDKAALKKRLVIAIIGQRESDKTNRWTLTESYQKYITSNDQEWTPELEYYVRLVQRLVETVSGSLQFPSIDWRFNEFPNIVSHTLYITCVELMALPVLPDVVANNILDVITKGVIPSDEIHFWINCIGMVIAALPDYYWSILHGRLLQTVTSSGLIKWQYDNLSPFQLFNFNLTHYNFFENKYSYMLALAHSVWHHAGLGQLIKIVQFIKEKLQPCIKTEEQLIFACHLIGPTLSRFSVERLSELTVTLYEMLEQVDRSQAHLKQMDPVCDLMYHIKYMFIGNSLKNEIDSIIRRLRPALQMRLRFIAQLNIEEIQPS